MKLNKVKTLDKQFLFSALISLSIVLLASIVSGNLVVGENVTADYFIGNGSLLTDLPFNANFLNITISEGGAIYFPTSNTVANRSFIVNYPSPSGLYLFNFLSRGGVGYVSYIHINPYNFYFRSFGNFTFYGGDFADGLGNIVSIAQAKAGYTHSQSDVGLINWTSTSTTNDFQTQGDLACGKGTSGNQCQLVMRSGVFGKTTTIQPATTGSSWTMTLPTSAGTNGYFLQTNGAGVTTWAQVSTMSDSNVDVATTPVSVNYNALTTDYLITMDASAGNKIVTLGKCGATFDGLSHFIKKTDSSANTVTINYYGAGFGTIEGATSYTLTTQYQGVGITCEGSIPIWYIWSKVS